MPQPGPNDNPYKKIGDLHNEAVIYVLRRLMEDNKNAKFQDTTQQKIVDYVAEFLQIIRNDKDRILSAQEYAHITLFLRDLETFDELLKTSAMHPEARAFILEMLDVKEKTDREDLIKLREIEQRILKSKLEDKDKKYPSLFAAVAIRSIELAEDPEGEYRKQREVLNKVNKRFRWPWKKDAKAALIVPLKVALSGDPVIALSVLGLAVGTGAAASLKEVIWPDKKNKQ